jgi:AcrR family transcriptional regulator
VSDSARRQELLEAAYQCVLGNGLADMSLRPLASQIGSSPRVLLFLFGSKEDLNRALLAWARAEELRYLAEQRDDHDSLAATGRRLLFPDQGPGRRPGDRRPALPVTGGGLVTATYCWAITTGRAGSVDV